MRNGLRFGIRDEEKALELARLYEELPIRKVGLSQRLWEEVMSLAYEQGTTVYDTAYHVLALSLGWKFLTRDKKYANRAKGVGEVEVMDS